MNVGSQRRGLASTVAMVPTLSFRALRTESASTLIKQFQQEEAAVVDNEVPEESGPSTPQGGPILERLEDLLAETAIYAVGDDQKAAVWKPPSLQIALEERRRSLWREGKAALETPLRAMGEMGIGIELYFFLMREVAKLFTALTVLHLPAMLLNARTFECTGDFRISSCYASSSSSRSFFIPRMSLGDACPSGVKRMFGVIEPSPKALGMVYCVVQLATALLVIVFTIDMHRHMSERLNELQLQHAQVSQFSVLVTNLPPDTDEPELVRHFHRRYDLSRPQVAYPIYGLDVRGTALLSGILGGSAAFVVQLIAAAILRARYPVMGRKAFWSMSVSNAFVFAAIIGYGISTAARSQQLGRPISVPPLKEEHAMMRSRREKQLLGMLGRRRRRKNANAAAAPWRRVPKASTLWMMRSPSPKSVKDIEHLRVVPRLNHNGHRKNHARYLDKWVADVAMIRSNGELIRQYMDLRNLWGQVQCSRASVRRWSEHYGPVPNMHRCRTALNRLELLVERMKDAQRELSRSVDRKGIDETTGAFVTFEHEWSAYRCVQDYAHSRSSLLRNYFQPINLRLHRKKRISSSQKNLARTTSKSNDEFAVETDSPHFHTTSLPIAVKAAASPDDVLWENLGVPGRVKNVRRLTTILLSGVLLAFTSAVVRAKIVARARVTIPTERGCREALAMHLGYYPSNSTCDLIDMLYANASFACPGSKNFLGLRGVHYARVDDTDPDCRGDCVRPSTQLRGPNHTVLARAAFYRQPSPRYTHNNLTLCDSPCHALRGGSQKCDALACGLTGWQDEGEECTNRPRRTTRFKKRTLVDCYCDRQVTEREHKTFKWELVLLRWAMSIIRPSLRVRWQAVCRVFLRERVIVKWVDRLLIVVIVLVNFLLELIFSLFSKFERHNSVSSSLVNTAVKTFLLSFLNTAMLVPLYNMQCSNQDAWAQFGLSWFCRYVLLGSHSGFSRTWYSEVGTTIVQTVVLNMVVNIISRLYMVLIQDPLLNWFQIDSCVTQNQLNKLLQPRRFDIDHRYSFAFTYILCTLVYCAGLPMLIPLSAAYFWTSYFVDRYLVLRRYKQPPSYDAKLSKLLLKLLPAAAVSHLFMASFMLSNQNIVVSGSIDDWRQRVWLAAWYVDFVSHILGSSSARSLSRICVAPLFVTALTAVAYKVLVVLSDVYNPELLPIPFFHTARRTRRYLERCVRSCRRTSLPTAKVAADDHLDSPNSPWISFNRFPLFCRNLPSSQECKIKENKNWIVPGGTVSRPMAWRQEEKNLRMGPLTTRPGFTEEYRCLAPARASELMDVVLEKRLLETVGGACSAITNIGTHIKNLSHMESATLTPSRRNRLKQSFTIGFWRHRYPRKVKPEESGHDETPKSPDQNQQQEQPRYKRLLEKVLVSTIRSSNGGKVDAAKQQVPVSSGRSPRSPRRDEIRRQIVRAKNQIISGILFAPNRWTEDNAIDAIDAGWRKVHEKNLSSKTIDESEAHVVEDTDTLLLPNTPSKVKTMLSSPRAAGVVELERVHIEGHRKGKVMRTWEIIVAERRLSSYDIISNPNYRLALEFLESVGTFRPKRELVKDIGIFKEQLVRLNDRVRRQAMERALSQKLQSMRVERFRRRELCRAVCDRLVQHVELREAQRSVRQSQRTLALAVKARVRAEARVVLEACCAKVEQIAALNAHRAACRAVTLLRAKRDREAVAGTLDTCVAAVELRFVHKRSRQLRELASSTEVAAVVASCVGQVEARIAGDEASRLRKERDRMRRKLKRHTSAPAAAQRTEQPRQNERLDVLERALEESKALTASYARMAEHQFAMLHAAPPATTPAPESEAPRTPPHIRERIRALELECAEARRTAQAAQAAQTVHQTQATQPFITTKRKELSPRTCAAVKSASEAERVASAALGERDAAIAACKAQRYRALEERDCAVLQSHEAERLALAAYAESRAAEEEQKRAAAEAREALALAAAASEEAETARREREAAIFEARESARLVEFAAAEAARADAQHAEAVATIDVRDEARDATARQLATTLDAAAVVANAAVRERDVVEACASMTKDALRAAEAAALAAMRHAERHEASAAELEARLVATTRDLGKQLESLQRRASEQATRIDAETSRHESEQAAARATLANHAADLDAQRQARARAELELVQVRKRLELEYDAEVAKMRRAKADAQARADHATREANRASTDVEIASARIANLSADRDAAHRANADAQQRLLETQNLLHAALNRLPAHELDTILAGASVSRGHLPFDALPARASILATAPPPNQTTSSVSLKHPSHLAAALHGPPKVIAPDVSDPPPPDASSSSSSRQGGGVVFLQHTGHDRRREPTAFDSAAWGSGWFPGSQ